MRRSVFITSLLILAMVGYLVWPIYTIRVLARAIEARDVATVMRHIDVDTVRKSLSDQVIDAYLKLSGKIGSPLLRGAVARSAGSIVDPMLADMMSPESLIDLLRTGWPTGVLKEQPAGVGGLTSANLGSAWQIYSSAHYGLRRFEITVPPSLPHNRRIELEFRLLKWRWQLVAVRLPPYLQIQLAEMLVKAQSKP